MRRRMLPKSLLVLVVGAVSVAVLAVFAATAVATSSRRPRARCPARLGSLPRSWGRHPSGARSSRPSSRRNAASPGRRDQPLHGHLQGVREHDPDLAAGDDAKGVRRADRAQETAFLNVLSRARSFVVSGATLTLKSAGGQGLATFKAQTQALAGSSWDVLAYNNGKQAVVSVLTETKLTAVFGTSGSLTGFAGCNDYNASYKASAPKIAIGPVASTRKHCEQPAASASRKRATLPRSRQPPPTGSKARGSSSAPPTGRSRSSYTESNAASPRTRFGEPARVPDHLLRFRSRNGLRSGDCGDLDAGRRSVCHLANFEARQGLDDASVVRDPHDSADTPADGADRFIHGLSRLGWCRAARRRFAKYKATAARRKGTRPTISSDSQSGSASLNPAATAAKTKPMP